MYPPVLFFPIMRGNEELEDFAGRDNSFGRRKRESDSTSQPQQQQQETDKGNKV